MLSHPVPPAPSASLGSFTPGGGVSVQGNAGGDDQFAARLKSTVPPENSASLSEKASTKLTMLPEKLASLKSTVPPENLAPAKRTSPPENSASGKPILPPENSASMKVIAPPENSTSG